MPEASVPEFRYKDAAPLHTAAYLRPGIMALLPRGWATGSLAGKRVLDIGCGNGYWCNEFASRGAQGVGIDASVQGIEHARRMFPACRFETMLIPDDPCATLAEQPFDLVISTEVVEHLYAPRQWARAAFASLKPGGTFICSTPYHGYLKNLALAAAGKMDWHFTALWDGGHIKFWSRRTLGTLLTEAGFVDVGFQGAGRLPYLWMSMVMSGHRPV